METKSPEELPCPNTVTVRRNPHRKARPTPFTNSCQQSIQSSSNLHDIPSFPIKDILSIQIPQSDPKPPMSENLNVYLRIRPLNSSSTTVGNNCGDQNLRSRGKNAWPQQPAKRSKAKEKNVKKKSNGSCITVNNSHSVTLSPPAALQELKRSKSEVYEGFSYVFSNSSQDEVFERMVNPLVEDFLCGKSGMLAALGPTGSGKTHTVFGSPRNPGMVPLILKRIFKQEDGSPAFSRSFYISIFEISSERGKGEKVSDLSTEGTDLSMHQSTIKGLQEVLINDVAQAESLIARAMLKRATAMTNANSQSSRSQCIINVRAAANGCEGEISVQSTDVVLTIVDLAGAEREKRTGNQGARLLESNFINNTSMVFGLCLRSLMEHQKNPRRVLQKHFQNSLLTRYLRDYLEGRKRMALILTVKSGAEDYLDTSYLLKQASPYMKIKFDNIEEPCKKRHFQIFPMVEQSKRMKFSGLDAHVIEGKIIGDNLKLSEEEPSQNNKVDSVDTASPRVDQDPVDRIKHERNHKIMQNFAKALWSVLKQYNEKLKVAESEIQRLKQNHNEERTKFLELQEEFNDLKSRCSCSKQNVAAATLAKTDNSSEAREHLEGHVCSPDETSIDLHSSIVEESECSSPRGICDSSSVEDQDVFHQVKAVEPSSELGLFSADNYREPKATVSRVAPDLQLPESVVSSTQSCPAVGDDNCASGELAQQPSEKDEGTVNLRLSDKKVAFTQVCNADVLDNQPKVDTSQKPSHTEKPKRRLLPASSILVRDVSTLDIEDESGKQKGNRVVKKVVAEGRQRTQGSVSLLHLLKSNLHL